MFVEFIAAVTMLLSGAAVDQHYKGNICLVDCNAEASYVAATVIMQSHDEYAN
jgi:hypothetical protein